MTDPRDLDPSPFEDLDSDIEFGKWLEIIDGAAVVRDYESRLSSDELARLRYLRRKAKGL